MGGSSKKQVVAYKYYEDQHIVLALSNFDFITHFWFANKLAWEGVAIGHNEGWQEIYIDKPELFGGEKQEGGVSGKVHIGMGWPAQSRMQKLVSRLGGTLMPAYRGVVSLFFDDFYFGNNPYIKELKVRAQAIHKLSDGSKQWYDEKAEISPLTYNLPDHLLPRGSSGWKYLVEPRNTPSDYSARDFDDSSWSTSSAPFYEGSPHPYLPSQGWVTSGGTPIPEDSQVWLRRTIYLDGPSVLKFDLAFDNQPALWVDGVPLDLPFGEFVGGEQTWVGSATATLDTGPHVIAYRVDETDIPDPNNYFYADMEITITAGPVVNADINPVHLIRECHTDKIWGGRYPETKMGASYYSAADTIYEEGLGVSFLFTEEIKWREIIEEVARHIDAIPYQDPDTGLMEIKLIRDDYDIDTLPVLDPSNSDLERYNDPNDTELFNAVIIQFWNRNTGENDSISLSDPALVDMAGGLNSKTYDYTAGLTNKRTATLVGNRDLARSTRPFYQGRVKTNRTVANLKPGDVFILRSPDDGINQIICRVTKRSESGLLNGDITLEFGEDIFGQVFSTFEEPAETLWVDPIGNPLNFPYQTAFEVPYYLVVQDQGEEATAALSDTAAFYGFAGGAPGTGAHLNYDLYVYPDGTTQEPDPEFSITSQFSPVAVVSEGVWETDLTIPVESLSRMESVRVGQILLVGDGLDSEREFLALDTPAANGDTQITVKRGLIDTVPRKIAAGTPIYFVETFYGGAETEYAPGEVVEGYGTPTNGRGYYLGPFTYHDIEMVGRFNKPYPPANLKIDGFSYPVDWFVPADNQVDFTWNHRDRVTQSDQVIDWFDAADYGPEASTSYLVEADAYDSDGVLIAANWLSENVGLTDTYTLDLDTVPPPANTLTLVVKVWTVRSGVTSLQASTYTFLLPGTEILVDEYTGLPVLDENGNYILMETP